MSLHNVGITGMNFAKNMIFYVPIDCVRFARYCGEMHSRHIFSLLWINQTVAKHEADAWPETRVSEVVISFTFILNNEKQTTQNKVHTYICFDRSEPT